MLIGYASQQPRSGLGPNLIVDPGFDTPADWLIPPGCSVANGLGSFTAAATLRALSPNPALVMTAGATYRTTFTLVNFTAGAVRPQVGGTSGTARTVPGTYVEDIVALNTSTPKLVATQSGTTLDVDDFKVQLSS